MSCIRLGLRLSPIGIQRVEHASYLTAKSNEIGVYE